MHLVTSAKLSKRKPHKVRKTWSESGVSIPTSSQSAVYRAVIKKFVKTFRRKFETCKLMFAL